MVFTRMMSARDKLMQFNLLLAERDLNAESITDWLAGLPLSQVISTSKLLYKAIRKMQKSTLSPTLAIMLLNLMHRTLQQYSQQYSRDYLLPNLMNYQKNFRSIIYLDVLQRKFAQVSLNLLKAQGKKLSSVEKAVLIHSAMSELGLLLLRRAQAYLSPAKNVWRWLHSLYHYAAGQQLLKNSITETNFQGIIHTTVAQLYKRITLLALANTSQLQQQDMERLYTLASEWADKVVLDPVSSQGYSLYFDTDLPPSHQTSLQKNEGGIVCYIQLDGLISHLRQLLKNQSSTQDKIKPGLANHVLEHLINLWSNHPQRRFARFPETGTIEVCIGLATVHYMVNNHYDLVGEFTQPVINATNPSLNHKLDFQTAEITPVLVPGELNNLSQEPDAWQIHQTRIEREEAQSKVDALASSHQIYRWQAVNSSAQGYCLYITGPMPELLQIGKVIGIKVEGTWCIGSIRWLQYNVAKGCLQTGVELLAPRAKGIALQLESQPQQFHGLLLPELSGTHWPASLITPTLIYQVGDVLTMQELTRQYKVKLTKLLSQNHSYARFEFTIL